MLQVCGWTDFDSGLFSASGAPHRLTRDCGFLRGGRRVVVWLGYRGFDIPCVRYMGVLIPLEISGLELIDVGSAEGIGKSMLVYLGHARSGCSQKKILIKSTKNYSYLICTVTYLS